jgi:predicted small lipoprotein YifL
MVGITRGLVTCPACGAESPVGLPQSATNTAVTTVPSPELDDEYADGDVSRKKRRQVRCPNGDLLYVYFEF